MKYALIDKESGLVRQWQDHAEFAFAPAAPDELIALPQDFEFPDGPRWVRDGAITDQAPPAVVVVPPFDQAAAMLRLRTMRAPILNALAGIGFDALAAGDQATVEAVGVARQGLKDITQLPAVLAAASDEAFDAAVMLRYKQLAAAAPANVRLAFKEIAA